MKCSQEEYQKKARFILEFCRNKTQCIFNLNDEIFGSECNGDKRHLSLTYVCSRFPIGLNNNILIPFGFNIDGSSQSSNGNQNILENLGQGLNSINGLIMNNKNSEIIEKCNFLIFIIFYIFFKIIVVCENNFLNIECPSDQFIDLNSANFGRNDLSICSPKSFFLIQKFSNTFCNGANVSNIVKNSCNSKRRCRVFVSSSTFGLICPNVSKYLTVRYKCIPRLESNNPCNDNPCGFGALCRNNNGFPLCSCPFQSTGNPNIRCCKNLRCGYYFIIYLFFVFMLH